MINDKLRKSLMARASAGLAAPGLSQPMKPPATPRALKRADLKPLNHQKRKK